MQPVAHSSVQREMENQAQEMVHIKWLGNKSKRYDGKENLEFISKIMREEDAAGPLVVGVGKNPLDQPWQGKAAEGSDNRISCSAYST